METAVLSEFDIAFLTAIRDPEKRKEVLEIMDRAEQEEVA